MLLLVGGLGVLGRSGGHCYALGSMSRTVALPNTLSRPWNEFDAYLFDIDGTLIRSEDAVHYFAFCDALTKVAGRPTNLDDVFVHGNTDPGILRDAFKRAGVDGSQWRPRLQEIRERMCAQVRTNRGDLRITVLPGVRAVLETLHANGKPMGVATGNFAGIGQTKLEHCGLWKFFAFGGFSDTSEYRRDMFKLALEQARGIAGADAAVCVFGDTAADIEAAHHNGLEVIVAATGIYSVDELAAAKPERLVLSLEELLAC
jgi:phosphoglycolate phosphatase